jgi:XTP/dITP diphosphohydrolase
MTSSAPAAPRRVVLASSNAGKLRELSELLGPLGIELLRQSDFAIEPPPETGASFLDNALIKARNAAQRTGLAALADDSGLEVDALGGAPGVHSARFAGAHASDEQNLQKLLLALNTIPDAARSARYRCVIVLVRSAEDPAPIVGVGVWEGRLIDTPRGSGGFGYDPAFVPLEPATALTVAEMSAERKNEHSHRGKALRQLLAQLTVQFGAPVSPAAPLALNLPGVTVPRT